MTRIKAGGALVVIKNYNRQQQATRTPLKKTATPTTVINNYGSAGFGYVVCKIG